MVGAALRHGRGALPHHPSRAARRARATTVGTPLSPHDEVRVVEPGTEAEVPDGEVGELCCRGPYTLRGYFDATEHNARAFTSDGFYRTGDLAAITVIDGERCVASRAASRT